MDSTILIIGAGTFGVSTAWHLSQNHSDPSKVTIIDRQSSPPSLSAAADINRILTADYPSSLYANLAKEALEFWTEDPDLEWYFHKVGRLVLDESDTHDDRRRVETQGVKLENLRRRWGVLDGTDTQHFSSAYLEPEAGWVDSATATWQFLETAIRRRVKREVANITELLFDRSTKSIRGAKAADGRLFLAETVILAAGAWTSALLSPLEDALDIADEDRIERQAQATAIVSASFPVSNEILKEIAGCKMPCVRYGNVGEVVPASRENKMLRYTKSDLGIINTIKTRSERCISQLLPKYARGDNHTPTEDLLLCEHPQVKDLFIITGGSFNGYKCVL
ncbi:hypothetical protein N0V82_005950 [Gnomoniopsis sp. IMI 355080]|nr:hypothetical protein N0V82_005950 [Gnomoniopsis sp. IMI 355080]